MSLYDQTGIAVGLIFVFGIFGAMFAVMACVEREP